MYMQTNKKWPLLKIYIIFACALEISNEKDGAKLYCFAMVSLASLNILYILFIP